MFRRACNLRIDPDRLLTLLSFETHNVPHGIRLNTPSHPLLLDLFHVGQPVACRGGILRFDRPDVSVDLRTARRWDIDLKALLIDLDCSTQAQSWAVAWSELKANHRRNGLPGMMQGFTPSEIVPAALTASEVLRQQATHAIFVLLRATRDFQQEDAGSAIRCLIGLGPGLTPSGDDFLVGYLAGLWSTVGNNPSRTQFLAALEAEISSTAPNTNEISRAYLRSAARGHVSELIATLAQQLRQANNMGSVRAATQAALQVGHTSGSDGVAGLLLGCLAWQRLSRLISYDLFPSSVYSGEISRSRSTGGWSYDSAPDLTIDLVYKVVFKSDPRS